MSNKIRGGKKDKLKKFPRILDYLEVHHRTVYDIIDELAMHGSLTPRRGGSITFLLPDAKYAKEINEIAESDNPEEATKMLRSLILLDLFETPADFTDKKENIPTLLGTKLLVKSVSKDKVEIEDGTLHKDDKFRPFSNRENIAVWKLTGKVKYEGVEKATRVRLPRQPRMKQSAEGGDDSEDFIARVEKDELQSMIAATASNTPRKCPMLNYVVAALRDFSAHNSDYYRHAKCILTMCPIIDFYLLYANPNIFNSATIATIRASQPIEDNNVEYYKQFATNYQAPALLEDPTAKLMTEAGTNEACQCRLTLSEAIMSQVNNKTVVDIMSIYNTLDQQNTLPNAVGSTTGCSPIYPAALANIFKSNHKLHLMLDEFSFLVFMGLMSIKAAVGTDRVEAVRRLFSLIKENYGPSLVNPEHKTRIDELALNIKDQLYQCVIPWWRHFGVHMPCAPDNAYIETHVKVGGDEADNPYSQDAIDVDSYFAGELEQLDNCPLCVSDHSIAEVKAYMNANNGKLPDGLL